MIRFFGFLSCAIFLCILTNQCAIKSVFYNLICCDYLIPDSQFSVTFWVNISVIICRVRELTHCKLIVHGSCATWQLLYTHSGQLWPSAGRWTGVTGNGFPALFSLFSSVSFSLLAAKSASEITSTTTFLSHLSQRCKFTVKRWFALRLKDIDSVSFTCLSSIKYSAAKNKVVSVTFLKEEELISCCSVLWPLPSFGWILKKKLVYGYWWWAFTLLPFHRKVNANDTWFIFWINILMRANVRSALRSSSSAFSFMVLQWYCLVLSA